MPPLKEITDKVIHFEQDIEKLDEVVTKSVEDMQEQENKLDDDYNKFLDLEKDLNMPKSNDDDIVKAFNAILNKLDNLDDKVISIKLVESILKTHECINTLGTNINGIHTNQNNISTKITLQYDEIVKSQSKTNFFLKHFKKVMFYMSVLIATSSYSLGATQHENIKPYFIKL